jgi:protein gp37
LEGKAPPNIILLTSVENQEQADKRIPELLKIPAACRGLSLEPLLGPVELKLPRIQELRGILNGTAPSIDWLIIGGESGPNARPCNVDWIRSLVAQGKAAARATFVKQVGSNSQMGREDAQIIRDKKGGAPDEWPADLRVQEWPKGF